MLLSVMNAKTTLIAGLTALSIAAVPATPALAWGEKEQGFVAGVATAVIGTDRSASSPTGDRSEIRRSGASARAAQRAGRPSRVTVCPALARVPPTN